MRLRWWSVALASEVRGMKIVSVSIGRGVKSRVVVASLENIWTGSGSAALWIVDGGGDDC